MKVLLPMICLLLTLAMPVSALEITAPEAPSSAEKIMPEEKEGFGESLLDLLRNVVMVVRPDLRRGIKTAAVLLAVVIVVRIFCMVSESSLSVAELAGAVAICSYLILDTGTMIGYGADTIMEMVDYGKLLFPVLTTALAAQGGISASASLYAGTVAFLTVIGSLISKLLLPGIYGFLALAMANGFLAEGFLKQLKEMIKASISWSLKTLLTVFTTYLSVTGVVSGTTDAAALKAAKVTIASFVPVVGGILSDASESVLVSASLAKNAAGIYGILAILAVFLEPFFKIGVQYLILKVTAAICGLMGTKSLTALIEDFSTAMGLILGMTGSVCLLLLISTVCYLKGVV